jgi:hypothetical protein
MIFIDVVFGMDESLIVVPRKLICSSGRCYLMATLTQAAKCGLKLYM